MINKSTLIFLNKLKKNNNRNWFSANKQLYEEAKNDFEFFVADLIDSIAQFDETVIGLEPKQCTFRIYKDTRFSKDKIPYKTNFGAAINQGGRKAERAGYYFHLEPDKCFIAGGRWMPSPEHLLMIRNAIAAKTSQFRRIVKAKDFKKYFKEIEGEKLKTTPKGFPKDHQAMEFLKFKNFIAYNKLDSKKVNSKILLNETAKVFKAMKPMIDFLNKACGLKV